LTAARSGCRLAIMALTGQIWIAPAAAEVDRARAGQYFAEVTALCAREGGRLWGVSLCGPMVIADPITGSIATSQPAPEAERPAGLGYSNAALQWGEQRWATYTWQQIEAANQRARLMLHELFHRIQPELGLLLPEPSNEHLDTVDGRYWMQLEWRALARALESTGPEREAALRDALAFRAERRGRFPRAADNERTLEINEGLAQYTATVAAVATHAEAVADAIDQLAKAPESESFVRNFAYASGAAYGVLLDETSPGWTRRLDGTDDLGKLLATVGGLEPAGDAEAAARRYGSAELRQTEERRASEHEARLAELRHRFVEGPVLVLPWARNWSFQGNQVTPLGDEGTVYPVVRATDDWGSLEAAQVLVATDQSKLVVPAPGKAKGTRLEGDGWTLEIAPGWVVRPGSRTGDFELVRE